MCTQNNSVSIRISISTHTGVSIQTSISMCRHISISIRRSWNGFRSIAVRRHIGIRINSKYKYSLNVNYMDN